MFVLMFNFMSHLSKLKLKKKIGKLFQCIKHSDCWAANIRKISGWETRDVKFLQCDIKTGTCICKKGYMDADDDRYNGCEAKINEGKCSWGSCSNHGVIHGQQCGAWKGLICDESSENSCCTCKQGNISKGGLHIRVVHPVFNLHALEWYWAYHSFFAPKFYFGSRL